MNIFIIFLIGIIFLLLLFIMKLLFDLKQINKQTKVKMSTDTRFTITSDLKIKEYKELCNHLNLLYDKYQKAQMDEVEKEKEFKEMLAYIAHDVRTPLTSVQGYLEILEKENRSQENENYYRIIDQRIYDIRHLLEQFFTYSKLLNHDFIINECDCHIYNICCESLAGFYQQFAKEGIKPLVIFKEHNLIIRAHQDLLRRVFDNLINNALVHGNGEVMIQQEDNHLVFSNNIKDDLEIDIDKIFEKFYKADSSRSNISSGLGLSIVKEIIDLFGWKIRAEIKNKTFCIIIDMGEYL